MAFGIVEILIGCAFLLMILFSAIAFFGPAAAKIAAGPISPLGFMVFVGLENGVVAAVFFTGGIGSIRCRNWARILMLVASGLWLGLGLIVTLFMAVMGPLIMRQAPGDIPPGVQRAIMVGLIVFTAALGILLPATFLFFYSRKSVKATCLATQAESGAAAPLQGTIAPGLPVPLAVLCALQALGAVSFLALLFMRTTYLFGVVLHGATAVLVTLPFSALNAYSAWATFRRKLIGWQITLFLVGVGAVSTLISYLHDPTMLKTLREMGDSEASLHLYEQMPNFALFMRVIMFVSLTAWLIFLLYTRKYFRAEEGS
jgi:hypothetical protein